MTLIWCKLQTFYMGANGKVDRALDSKSKGLGFDSYCWSCVEVSGKLIILCCLCPFSNNGYLVEWKMFNYDTWLQLQKMWWILLRGDNPNRLYWNTGVNILQSAVLTRISRLQTYFFVQVRLRTEAPRTPRLTQLGFECMTPRSWQYSSCHWDVCSNYIYVLLFYIRVYVSRMHYNIPFAVLCYAFLFLQLILLINP